MSPARNAAPVTGRSPATIPAATRDMALWGSKPSWAPTQSAQSLHPVPRHHCRVATTATCSVSRAVAA